MKNFKYSLVASTLALASVNSIAQTYDVVDIVGVEGTRQSYGVGLNNNDIAVGISRDHFSYPIDFDNLNFGSLEIELVTAKLNNPQLYVNVVYEDILAGNINADALDFIKLFLNNRENSNATQKLGNQTAFIADTTGTSEITYFDQVAAGLFNKSRNTIDIVNAVSDNGIAVGSATAMYFKTDFTPEVAEGDTIPTTTEIWMKNFLDKKGVVTSGDQRVIIESPFTEFGGASGLTDISESNYVVGYAAVSLSQNGQEGIDSNCATLTDPVGLYNCSWTVRNALLATTPAQTLYEFRAMRWKLDNNLVVTETIDLGLTFTPKETDIRDHTSVATGVNEFGHVVGYSDGYKNTSDFDNNRVTRIIATYHDGTDYKDFIDHETYFESKAYDINDNNVAVGYVTRFVNSVRTNQFFYYDANSDTATYPEGFFGSSASEAHGINNAGKIVGIAEVESSFGTTRRKRGFIYDIAANSITDLNDLITCDHPYTIAEARAINDNGVIIGTALLDVSLRDSLGNVVTDDNGDVVMEQASRAVKLVPVAGGVVDDCTAVEKPTYERKGAGFGFGALLVLSGLFGFRRLVR